MADCDFDSDTNCESCKKNDCNKELERLSKVVTLSINIAAAVKQNIYHKAQHIVIFNADIQKIYLPLHLFVIGSMIAFVEITLP
jgi:hypothetical protein